MSNFLQKQQTLLYKTLHWMLCFISLWVCSLAVAENATNSGIEWELGLSNDTSYLSGFYDEEMPRYVAYDIGLYSELSYTAETFTVGSADWGAPTVYVVGDYGANKNSQNRSEKGLEEGTLGVRWGALDFGVIRTDYASSSFISPEDDDDDRLAEREEGEAAEKVYFVGIEMDSLKTYFSREGSNENRNDFVSAEYDVNDDLTLKLEYERELDDGESLDTTGLSVEKKINGWDVSYEIEYNRDELGHSLDLSKTLDDDSEVSVGCEYVSEREEIDDDEDESDFEDNQNLKNREISCYSNYTYPINRYASFVFETGFNREDDRTEVGVLLGLSLEFEASSSDD